MKTFYYYLVAWFSKWILNRSIPIHEDPKAAFEFAEYHCAENIVPHLEKFSGLKNKRILDVGCGQGGVSYALSRDNEVIGLDITLQRLMWRPGQLENPPLILLADGLKIPCPNESFDIVILSDVLEHIEDPRLAIREVGRVLKLNGLAFFSFTPFYGPRGGHLWNYIPIPYVHFVLPYKVTRMTINNLGSLGPLATSERLLRQYESLNRLKILDFVSYCKSSNLQLLWEKIDSFLGWKPRTIPDLFSLEYAAIARKSANNDAESPHST